MLFADFFQNIVEMFGNLGQAMWEFLNASFYIGQVRVTVFTLLPWFFGGAAIVAFIVKKVLL